jgi:DNA repair exonuclease SbcCD ATPase subunit
MLFFRKTDEQELEKLLKLEAKDRARLQELESKFGALKPRWNELQAEAERLQANYANSDDVYSREVSESFWAERGPELKRQIEEAIRRRDALTMGYERQIRELKNQLHYRNEAVVSGFAAWLHQVSGQLPAGLAAELLQVQATIRKSQNLASNVDLITRSAERVLDIDGPTAIPVLNLAALVKAALAITPAAA